MRRGAGVWLVLFAAYAGTIGLNATATARYSPDEAHRLLTAASIAHDQDLDLRNQYAQRAWRAWYPGPLRPTAQTTAGRLAEPQGIGFPLLLAPAYALGGPVLCALECAALLALAFTLGGALARRLVPEPWATRAVLIAGLSAPALAAATTIQPETAGAALLAGGLLLALKARDEPRLRYPLGCAACLAPLPWIALDLVPAGLVIAVAMFRWLRRRQRGLYGFIALEAVLTSGVVYVSVVERIYGGLTPYAARLSSGPITGASSAGDYARRLLRIAGLLIDRESGLLRWAPFAALGLFALWLLIRSRRERIAAAISEQVDVEVTATLLVLACAASVGVAAFLAPRLHGPWLVPGAVVSILPLGGALCAWSLRHAPRAGAVLAAVTLAGSVWLVAGGYAEHGSTAVAPPHGALPWGGAERLLPRF